MTSRSGAIASRDFVRHRYTERNVVPPRRLRQKRARPLYLLSPHLSVAEIEPTYLVNYPRCRRPCSSSHYTKITNSAGGRRHNIRLNRSICPRARFDDDYPRGSTARLRRAVSSSNRVRSPAPSASKTRGKSGYHRATYRSKGVERRFDPDTTKQRTA
jgi:hypothetical protein